MDIKNQIIACIHTHAFSNYSHKLFRKTPGKPKVVNRISWPKIPDFQNCYIYKNIEAYKIIYRIIMQAWQKNKNKKEILNYYLDPKLFINIHNRRNYDILIKIYF